MTQYHTFMCFILTNINVLSDSNISPTLSTRMVMGYLKTTPINQKISWKNSISEHTSMIAEYSDPVIDNVTAF